MASTLLASIWTTLRCSARAFSRTRALVCRVAPILPSSSDLTRSAILWYEMNESSAIPRAMGPMTRSRSLLFTDDLVLTLRSSDTLHPSCGFPKRFAGWSFGTRSISGSLGVRGLFVLYSS